ncbi:endothelial zinc finger protein induced by tumor necrosis factor alpha-like isoform X2 [Toxorhynchites rutilus septentrionalis]|uniref:endothelial zinc finger protein induced by tumor necrosis factor alpha-like isoform X2 n=1 Tax=Toxorhynchites rutilus septentrionalis TaxID=329112 RepID=UPI0024797760|nr:endothelial zinc finger protein induced by tumor necrosis factor alpha-like isoform X2 [Toxorhynchites rutilus septentrionalis]
MAINFSASFAACLAAGFKMPRQIMYCISQDTPYVLYKDSQEAAERTAALGGQWGGEIYPALQQGSQGHVTAHNNGQISLAGAASHQHHQSQQSQQHTPNSPQNQESRSQQPGKQANGQLHSPATSPYPQNNGSEMDKAIMKAQNMQNTIAQQQNGPLNQVQVTGATGSPSQNIEHPNHQTNSSGQNQQNQTSQPQQQSNVPITGQQQQQQTQQCFPDPAQPDISYYTQRHHGPQATMIPSPAFTPLHHYLNKSGVLSSMPAGMEQGNPLEQYAVPDLIHGNQIHHTPSNGTHKSKGSELRLFKCLTCGKDFKQKSTLLQHERIHTDSRPYGCPAVECGKRFRQQSHLTQHLRIHANEKPFVCPFCQRAFRQRAILNQHIRIHSGDKPFGCPYPECGKKFRQKAILNQHVRTHQDVSPHLIFKNGPHATLWPQDVPYPPEQEGQPKDEQTYGEETSQGTPESRGCFSPEGILQYPSYFKDTKGANHSIFGNNLPYLNKSTGGKTILQDVIQHGRSAGMPLYVRCPICQKEFKQKSTLLQHGCIHIESRPYPCPECGKRFRQQSHLTQHLRIHTNEKPFGCPYCPRFFRQRTILNQHIRIHTGEKPYKCAQCGKDFRQKAILDQHTRTHQGDRPFCCPMPNCRRRFATEQEVKKHIDNHMNPHSSKSRKMATMAALNNNNNINNHNNNNNNNSNNNNNNNIVAEQKVSPNFVMDKQNNPVQRMAPVKHELYFPQCYGPPFNQPFIGDTTVVTANTTTAVNGSSSGTHPILPPAVSTTNPVNGSNSNPQPSHTTSTITAVPGAGPAVIATPAPQAVVAQ